MLSAACTGPVAPADSGSEASSTEAVGTYGTEGSDETDATSESEASSETGTPSEDLPDATDPPDPLGDCEQLEQLLVALDDDPGAGEALVDAFIVEHSYAEHGFPLVEDTRLCVVYRGEDPGAVSVAGDFNGWTAGVEWLSPTPLPAFGYAIIELDAAPVGLYKFVHPGEDYRADPLARRYGWDEFGAYSQIDAIAGRSHHEHWPAFAEGAGELAPRNLTIWLPADADAGDPLPVIYMHDGQNLFDPAALFGGWQVSAILDEAIEAGVVRPVVIAALDNSPARMDEYTQVGDVLDGVPVGGRADEYADFLVEGVLPFVHDRYAQVVATDAANAAVLGSSLGGLVSLYIGLRHGDRFAQVGSMSGTIAWGTFGAANPTIVDLYLADPPGGLRVYLDSGGGEGLGCPEGGADNYCGNLELANTLRGLGWVDEEDLFYRWEPGAPHNEAAWAGRLLPALVDWFPGPG